MKGIIVYLALLMATLIGIAMLTGCNKAPSQLNVQEEAALFFDIQIKGSEFPQEAGIEVKIKVARDGRIAAHASVTIDRSPKGVRFKEAISGEEKYEIVLVFSEAVDAYRQLRDNIEVVDEDGEGQSIWSYGEDGERLTLIMRDDLDPGKYTVVYNGEGGLEGRDGSDVAAFEGTFIVEDSVAIVVPTPEIPETPTEHKRNR